MYEIVLRLSVSVPYERGFQHLYMYFFCDDE